jgi:hypothetical protein
MSKPSGKFTSVAEGVEEGVEWAVCKAPPFAEPARNGYCRIPDDKRDWEDLIDVHGGVTYGGTNWIGFDTMHAGDYWPGNPQLFTRLRNDDIEWTEEMVIEETKQMARQVAMIRDYSENHQLVQAMNSDRDQEDS